MRYFSLNLNLNLKMMQVSSLFNSVQANDVVLHRNVQLFHQMMNGKEDNNDTIMEALHHVLVHSLMFSNGVVWSRLVHFWIRILSEMKEMERESIWRLLLQYANASESKIRANCCLLLEKSIEKLGDAAIT